MPEVYMALVGMNKRSAHEVLYSVAEDKRPQKAGGAYLSPEYVGVAIGWSSLNYADALRRAQELRTERVPLRKAPSKKATR
jgi:hypothetical protein